MFFREITIKMEERADVLRNMQICRFCLNDNGPFTNIYERDKHDGKHIPLPLQIMACVAIEVRKSTNILIKFALTLLLC